MKIVISAWHMQDFNVGLGRYCRGLIEALGRVDQENTYEVLFRNGPVDLPERPNMRYRVVRVPIFKRRVWEQCAPFMTGPYDVLHFPYDSSVAFKRGRFVATIHDLKPLMCPELKARKNVNSLFSRLLLGDKWSKIDHVVTVSQCSRRDILERLGLGKDRVSVVYNGVDLEQFHQDSGTTGSPPARPSRPYILCVSGGDPTKNVALLIDAYAELPSWFRRTYDLVLVGNLRRSAGLHDQAVQRGVRAQVVFTGVVANDRLVRLYQGATAFVFPSRYEGFGLPLLEAMACGCPVISSNASSLPEVAGDAAVLFDPTDVKALVRAMEQVLSDAALRQDLIARGLNQASQFSWERTARETMVVYRKACERSSSD